MFLVFFSDISPVHRANPFWKSVYRLARDSYMTKKGMRGFKSHLVAQIIFANQTIHQAIRWLDGITPLGYALPNLDL